MRCQVEQDLRNHLLAQDQSERREGLRNSLIANRMFDQIESPIAWVSVVLELDETFSTDPNRMAALLNAIRKALNNATRAQGLEELADLLDPIRQREAERYVDANWQRLTEVERIGDE